MWIHVLAAAIWIGGAAFLALVAVPAMRRATTDARAYRDLLEAVVLRFRVVAWFALGLLVATGLLQMTTYGFEAMLTGRVGRVLSAKLALVFLVLALSAWHDFGVGPRALAIMRDAPESAEADRLRRTAGWIGRITFVLAIAIVGLAVKLFRG